MGDFNIKKYLKILLVICASLVIFVSVSIVGSLITIPIKMADECLVSEIKEYKSPGSTRTVVVTRKNCSETGRRLEVFLSKLSDNSGEILLDFEVDKSGNIPISVEVEWLGENDLVIHLPKGYGHYTSQEQRAGVNILYEHSS